MSPVRASAPTSQAALAAYAVGLCLACHGKDPAIGATRLGWSVDTVAVIGVSDGDSTQEFGQLIAAEISAIGDVVLLDLRRPGIFWFDQAGRFKSATRPGRGPGEVAQPRAITVDSRGGVVVLDPGNARIAYFRVSDGRVVLDSSIHTPYVTGSLCLLGERLYAGFLRDGMVAHALGSDGHPLLSFGPAPEVTGLEALGQFATQAQRQIIEPRLFCDSFQDRVVLAGRSHALVRAYDTTGHLSWSVQLGDIHSVGFEVRHPGTVEGVFDDVHGASFVRSLIPWDPQHVLIQYVKRLPGQPPDGREFHGIDSRLLDLATGAEVARSDGLPLLAAVRGDRFVAIENVPYPRAVVGRRR
jgi:hypothetical protein